MIKNLVSLALLIISVILNLKHGWDMFDYKNNPESVKMMNALGISGWLVPFFLVLTIAVAILLLLPKTFFIGNLVNAMSIVLIMALALRAGNYKIALMEIPFLAMPLIMIWLKYPFKK
jgi:hypothetical protein